MIVNVCQRQHNDNQRKKEPVGMTKLVNNFQKYQSIYKPQHIESSNHSKCNITYKPICIGRREQAIKELQYAVINKIDDSHNKHRNS